MAIDQCSLQLISGDGDFDAAVLDDFVKSVKLSECGVSYAVVAIIGPQSSGKSTLLNHLFCTNFLEMDASQGRRQTTKGIWIAKAAGIEPSTIVLDLEGTDGKERGEDDTVFEKQIALFALAIADVVMINLWCHDIGREQASNKPLLRTVFQVMMWLFAPRRTTLLFVIRDKTRTPLERLEADLREDIQMIWETVPKPEACERTPLRDFFNVQVAALCSYDFQEEKFKEQVVQLKNKFCNSIVPGGLAGDRQETVPGSGFSRSAQKMWEDIRDNKDLDLPSHKVLVGTFRCEEIANEQIVRFLADGKWLALEHAIKSGPVSQFGKQMSSILGTYLLEYDKEAMYFDEGIRNDEHKKLEANLLQVVHPAYVTLLGHLSSQANEGFKSQLEKALRGEGFAASVRNCNQSCVLEFDKQCEDAAVQQADWDASKVKEKLSHDIEAYAFSLCSMKLSKIVARCEEKLSESIVAPVESLLEDSRSESWYLIRDHLDSCTYPVYSEFQDSIRGFELDELTRENMLQSIDEYARGLVEKKAREMAQMVLSLMKERFNKAFNFDEKTIPRRWNTSVDIEKIILYARTKSLKMLSVMAAICLDECPDDMEEILFLCLMDTSKLGSSSDRLWRLK